MKTSVFVYSLNNYLLNISSVPETEYILGMQWFILHVATNRYNLMGLGEGRD